MSVRKPIGRDLDGRDFEWTYRWLVRAALIGTAGVLLYLAFGGRGVVAQFLFYTVALLWGAGIVVTCAVAYRAQRKRALASVYAEKYRRSSNYLIIGGGMIVLSGVLAIVLMQALDVPLETPAVYGPALIVACIGLALAIYRIALMLYFDISIRVAKASTEGGG